MDAGFLNFHGGEQFSTFESSYFMDPSGDESQYSEETSDHKYSWDWDRERELNGDIGLIPVMNSSNEDDCVLSTSPPSKEDFHKIMCDWQQLVNVEFEDIEELTSDILNDSPDHNELPNKESTDDECVNKSSASCHDNSKQVLSNNTDQTLDFRKIYKPARTCKSRQIPHGGKKIDMKNQRYILDNDSDEDDHVDVETLSPADLSENKSHIKNISSEIISDNEQELIIVKKEPIDILNNLQVVKKEQFPVDHVSSESSFCSSTFDVSEQTTSAIIEPDDLDRILEHCSNTLDESGQATSAVIEAGDLDSLLEQFEAREQETQQIHEDVKSDVCNIPAKRKSDTTTIDKKNESNNVLLISSEKVLIDHDYCTITSFKKESGFSSCEDEDQTVLHSQPTVKTADGKLMVSLLKINTIKKRKLNLEEYKKLRKNRRFYRAPDFHKDENARRLRKMCVQPVAPPDFELRTLVSIGVNTDQSWGCLQELVNDSKVDFSINSFITSLVDHLPKSNKVLIEHAQDKTIVYLDKNRPRIKTSNKSSQTSYQTGESSRSSSCSSRSSSRSPPPRRRRSNSEKMREVEERRVIYVGRIADTVTRDDLRRRFDHFGPIINVSVHFRKTGDNYGFVTFKCRQDAYEAVEHGNDDKTQPQYDLSFGGRRIFCQTNYSDLDNLQDNEAYPVSQDNQSDDTFDVLLREVRAKLLKKEC